MPNEKVKRGPEQQQQQQKLLRLILEQITRKVAHELHTKASEKGYFGIKDVHESDFDPVKLWVMGPPCGSKVGRTPTYCTVMVARHVRGQHVNYVGNNVGTKGEG